MEHAANVPAINAAAYTSCPGCGRTVLVEKAVRNRTTRYADYCLVCYLKALRLQHHPEGVQEYLEFK